MKYFNYKYIYMLSLLLLAYSLGFKIGYKSIHKTQDGQVGYKYCIEELMNRCSLIINPIQQDTCIARCLKLKMVIDGSRVE